METPQIISQENSAKGPGSLLTEARLKLGLDPKNVAEMLHLREYQVRALEADDYENLPEPTYVKGYLRAYCQLLSLEPDSIIQMYSDFVMPPVKESFEGLAPEKQVASSDNLVKLVSVVMVALVAGLAIAFWFGSQEDETESGRSTTAMVATPDPQQAPTVIVDEANDESGEPAARVDELTVPAGPEMQSPIAVAPPAAPKTTPAETQVSPPVVAEARPVQAPPVDAPANVSLLPELDSSARTHLTLKVSAGSWIDIRDAKGNKLVYETVPAGREIPLEGLAPFNVFLGNAAGVEVLIEGKLYDFSSHKRGLTARFKLEKPGATQ